MPQSGYDIIADEYYDVRHITSRNFDQTTAYALKNWKLARHDGLILEVGAGRGRSSEFLGLAGERVIQLDSSDKMLHLPNREACLLKVHADACAIPLSSQQFTAVVGFLADPFFGLDSLAEAWRMLIDGGELVVTLPTLQWGEPLRRRLAIDLMTTRFKIIGKESVVKLPSILHSKQRIIDMLKLTKFRQISVIDVPLPARVPDVSKDITSVYDELKIKREDLPLIHVIRAVR